MHLVHPVLVHFAVAFLAAGSLVEVCGLAFRRDAAARFGGTLVLAGTLTLIPTIVAGYLAANSLVLTVGAVRAVEAHERAV